LENFEIKISKNNLECVSRFLSKPNKKFEVTCPAKFSEVQHGGKARKKENH
jgi:hypothetical protein